MSATDNDNWKDVKSFFRTPPVSREEVDAVAPSLHASLEKALERLEAPDAYETYQAFLEQHQQQQEEDRQSSKRQKLQQEAQQQAIVEGDPRSYQLALLDRAKERNTIVHLGTGAGKTLIALLLIQEYAHAFAQNQQTVFLVPSVALAIQQSTTLRANLPNYSVATAFSTTVHTQAARLELSQANIVVATHGACLDLLSYYGDLFHMNRINLLILDECHNCTGNSAYAVLMKSFYHATNPRPHVLGLTASPLINIKLHHSDAQLTEQLAKLESTLDARVSSYSQLLDGQEEEEEDSMLLQKDTQEKAVYFENCNTNKPLLSVETYQLHETRRKELRQLEQLYSDLGPLVVSLYCQRLAQEISRNVYEKESGDEFRNAVSYLEDVVSFCKEQCKKDGGGRTDKLLALEELLKEQMHKRTDAVGLVFVERRVTAMALNQYFRCRREALKDGSNWPLAGRTRKKETTVDRSQEAKDGQYEDSEEDIEIIVYRKPRHSSEASQFEDAEDDSSLPVLGTNTKPFASTPMASHPEKTEIAEEPELIRCGVLVRNPTHLFNSLAKGRRLRPDQEEEAKQAWLHTEASIREVLNDLRRGEINVLVATSVVEEGVDVQACSFVAVFDSVKTLKGYIQMKGRARQKDASFFVFHDKSRLTSDLSLDEVQKMELKMELFLAERANNEVHEPRNTSVEEPGDDGSSILSVEIQAIEDGFYKTDYGIVNLRSAKSLLNRYVLAQPMDSVVRSSRQSLRAHLPLFDGFSTKLTLPAHLAPGGGRRFVKLPERYCGRSKKERESILALMACVGLHRHGLLSERLLPLSRNDIQARILSVMEKDLPAFAVEGLDTGFDGDVGTERFLYRIHQDGGDRFDRFQDVLKSNEQDLAILSSVPLDGIPEYHREHAEIGKVTYSLHLVHKIACSEEEFKILADFFTVVFNARWRRRTRSSYFQFNQEVDYRIGLTNVDGELDWDMMKRTIAESKRSREDRIDAVRTGTKRLERPRLWCPLYDENTQYIAYGDSGLRCDAPFPHKEGKNDSVHNYQDYFRLQRGFSVDTDSPLFVAQRLWRLPLHERTAAVPEEKRDASVSDVAAADAKYATCGGLVSVKLPAHACLEPALADAGLFFSCLLLPQFLYHIERHWALLRFINHCQTNLPLLGACLGRLPASTVITVLTAKSCREAESYERHEWLGDAVLKVIQTDVLLKSTDLSNWIRNLHEGDLNGVRSVMGSNDRLEETCRRLGIDRFILTVPLERGKWAPNGMELIAPTATPTQPGNKIPSGKILADVMEAILGLVYLESGYDNALSVANEMQLTIPWAEQVDGDEQDAPSGKVTALTEAKKFTGYESFRSPSLVTEALTHPTCLHAETSSYQRLEWIGDAVLCLAAREWIFRTFDTLEIGEMVLLEASLVCNETLAYLSLRSGLYGHLNHLDQTLPARIESYDWSVRELGRGLWGTDPPKPIADIVESLIGAVHIDGGFSEGQKAALHVLSPILDMFRNVTTRAVQLYPRQKLSELGGKLLVLNHLTEEEYAQAYPGSKVWLGTQWGPVHREGHKSVASIRCLGESLVSLADVTAPAAVNRACALALAVFERNEPLLHRFMAVRSELERAATGNKDETEEDAK